MVVVAAVVEAGANYQIVTRQTGQAGWLPEAPLALLCLSFCASQKKKQPDQPQPQHELSDACPPGKCDGTG